MKYKVINIYRDVTDTGRMFLRLEGVPEIAQNANGEVEFTESVCKKTVIEFDPALIKSYEDTFNAGNKIVFYGEMVDFVSDFPVRRIASSDIIVAGKTVKKGEAYGEAMTTIALFVIKGQTPSQVFTSMLNSGTLKKKSNISVIVQFVRRCWYAVVKWLSRFYVWLMVWLVLGWSFILGMWFCYGVVLEDCWPIETVEEITAVITVWLVQGIVFNTVVYVIYVSVMGIRRLYGHIKVVRILSVLLIYVLLVLLLVSLLVYKAHTY